MLNECGQADAPLSVQSVVGCAEAAKALPTQPPNKKNTTSTRGKRNDLSGTNRNHRRPHVRNGSPSNGNRNRRSAHAGNRRPNRGGTPTGGRSRSALRVRARPTTRTSPTSRWPKPRQRPPTFPAAAPRRSGSRRRNRRPKRKSTRRQLCARREPSTMRVTPACGSTTPPADHDRPLSVETPPAPDSSTCNRRLLRSRILNAELRAQDRLLRRGWELLRPIPATALRPHRGCPMPLP
mmetsp:Transcript_100301/g.289593  ORF Transcript_100301/g.289593 Transcript_100301/m.289593 type:complete len:237 (-) Transcript_100301:112-822(-)